MRELLRCRRIRPGLNRIRARAHRNPGRHRSRARRRAAPGGERASLDRLLLSAAPADRGRARRHRRPRGDLRPGAGVDELPHTEGGDRAGQQLALRPRRQRLEREHQPGARRGAGAEDRRGLDQLQQPVRRRRRLRRLPRVRLRPRRRPRGPARIPEAGLRGEDAAAAGQGPAGRHRNGDQRSHRPHGEDVHRRQAGAAGQRPFAAGDRRQGPSPRPGRCRRPQGHPQRRRGRAQGRGLVEIGSAHAGPDHLLRRREPGRARRRVRRAAARHDRQQIQGREAGSGCRRRAAVQLRRLGRQARRRRARAAAALARPRRANRSASSAPSVRGPIRCSAWCR